MCVIGLVGPFASGCSTVAKKIHEFYDYEVLSLSDELRSLFKRRIQIQSLTDRNYKILAMQSEENMGRII